MSKHVVRQEIKLHFSTKKLTLSSIFDGNTKLFFFSKTLSLYFIFTLNSLKWCGAYTQQKSYNL